MFILASQSPRRKWLMSEDITPDFKVVVSHTDEHYPEELKSPKDIVKFIARQKGEVVHKDYPNDITISADTIVVLDDEIIGKPIDANDAKRMLKHLSNKTHIVYTGFAIFKDEIVINDVVESKVIFNDLSDDLIERYVLTGSPLDKAGAYGMQDNEDYPIVKEIVGSIKNVIGFPTKEIKEYLEKSKLI